MAALAACAAALYARTLAYDYVWDDLMYLGGFSHYQGLEGVVRAVTEPFFLYPDYYRPLVMLSFAVSKEPAVQHGMNIALHALNTVLVFLCACALIPRAVHGKAASFGAPALGALVFAAHPVAVETVAWVSGRFDTLMCAFVLGTCLVVLGGRLTRGRLALVFVLFTLAMGSKETAIGLPVALPFLLALKYRLVGEETGEKKDMLQQLAGLLGGLALAAMLYIAIRMAVIPSLFSWDARATVRNGSLLDKINIASMAVAEFVKLLVNPWSHSAPMHLFQYERGSGVLPQAAIVMVCVPSLLAAAFLKKPRLNFSLALLAALGMSWPALHLVGFPDAGNIITDRYALTPLAVLLVALAAIAGTWLARRTPAMGEGGKRALVYAGVLGLLWAGALAAHTNITIPMWRNEYVFWPFAYRHAPSHKEVYANYIRMLMVQERWEDAYTEVEKFWEKRPDVLARPTVEDITNWMVIRAKLGDYNGALEWFERFGQRFDENIMKTGEERRTLGIFYRARGIIDSEAGYWGQALHWHEKSLQVSPTDVRSAFRYAEALFMNGQPEKAEEVFNRALTSSTKDVATWALEWRKTWRLPEAAAGGAGQGASAPAPAP